MEGVKEVEERNNIPFRNLINLCSDTENLHIFLPFPPMKL
jgi:hypothetical protein